MAGRQSTCRLEMRCGIGWARAKYGHRRELQRLAEAAWPQRGQHGWDALRIVRLRDQQIVWQLLPNQPAREAN